MVSFKQKLKVIYPYFGLVFVILFFLITTGGKIVGPDNLQTLLNQSYTLILLTAGMTFVYSHGGIDLSVGSVYALAQMAAGLVVMSTDAPVLALPASIITAMICSFITGIITVKLRVPAFVASLCMQFLGRGVVSTVVSKNKIVVPQELIALDNWTLKAVVLVVVVIICYILFEYTAIGKYNKAIGENITAVEQSGIKTDNYRVYAYLIGGFTMGLAAFFGLCRSGSMTTQTGLGMELNVIIALVLGGLSLGGGSKSSLRCGIIGSIITVILANGLVIMGVVYTYVNAVNGFIFLIVVYLTYMRNKRGLLPR